jgi:nucleoside-diphosphate-sugar epimerase
MIFVTGGTGFLGKHLLPALCRSGRVIKVLTRQPEAHPWLAQYPNVTVVQGDLSDYDVLYEHMQGCSQVIHAGGMFRFWGDEQAFLSTNAIGTKNMLAAALNTGIKRFVHISSIAVIGQPDPTHVIDEDYPPNPTDAYQVSKLEGEQQALRAWNEHGLDVVVLRPGAFYGPLGTYAFNRLFFQDPMRGIIMQIDGGKHVIFPAYIADVVTGILSALEKGRSGEIYNICGDWISHKDAFDVVCQEAGLWYPRLTIPGWMGIGASHVLEVISRLTGQEPFWPINLKSYVYNDWRVTSDKARRELDFAPTDFREGAQRTITWYRDNRPDKIPETEC